MHMPLMGRSMRCKPLTSVPGVQDYLYSYREKIQAVTADDVLKAAQRHLHPRQQKVVVIADAATYEKELGRVGRSVVRLDID